MSLGHGVPLRGMEFDSVSPDRPAEIGILMTELPRRRRDSGRNGYRYLQDYGWARKPRSANRRINIWSWAHARQSVPGLLARVAERTPSRRRAARVVYLDLRHPRREKTAGASAVYLCELAKAYVGIDPVKSRSVRPTAHYTMGGIETDQQCETRIKGCLPWANARPLTPLAPTVWAPTRWPSWWSSATRRPGSECMQHAAPGGEQTAPPSMQAADVEQRLKISSTQEGNENWAKIRDGQAVDGGRLRHLPHAELMQKTTSWLNCRNALLSCVRITGCSSVFNTDLAHH